MKIVPAYDDDFDRVAFPFDTSESAAPKSGTLPEREGLFRRVFNAKTQDFLLGAAFVGGASYATRIGVLTAATAAGTAALPAVLAAGAFTGLAAGSVRFYLEYKKARYDFGDPEVRKILYKQLLKSTALSTIGGGVGYAFVNHYDVIVDVAQKTGIPAWIGGNLTALANSSLGIAVAEFSAPAVQALGQFAFAAKTAIGETYNAIPGISETVGNVKAFAGQFYEGAASYLKGAYDSLPDVRGGVETAVQSVKGWWKSAMDTIGLSQAVQASTPAAADMAPPADVPVAAEAISSVHTVKPLRFLPDGTLIPEDAPRVAAEEFFAGNTSPDELGAEFLTKQPFEMVKGLPGGLPSVQDATPPQAVAVEMQVQEPVSAPASEPVTPEPAALPEAGTQTAETPQYVQDYLAGITEIKQSVPSFAGLDFERTAYGFEFPKFDANSTPEYLPKLSEKFTVRPWGDRFELLASEVSSENVSDVFANLSDSSAGGRSVTDIFERKAFSDQAGQAMAKSAGIDMNKSVVAEMPASSPAPASASGAEQVAVSASSTVSMKEQIGSYFEGKHLSRRAGRIMEKAMSGDLQGQKDLAMNLLHGERGFPKDPVMAMKLYDNVIAQGSVEGKHPRGAVFQAIRDKAWVQFYGYGDIPADQDAAKSTMRKLAEFNSGARRMLREWTGEKVRHVATASKHAVASVRDSVAGKMPDSLSCDFTKVNNKVVSASCSYRGALGLKAGDKISFNP